MTRVAAALGAGALLAGSGLLLAAPVEAASLNNGPTYNRATKTVSVTATHGGLEAITLTLSGPGAAPISVSRAALEGPATINRPGITLNGTYVAVVTSSVDGGDRRGELAVAEPPATPTGVSATGGDVGVATVTWNDNIEPDLTGYSVLEGGRTVDTKTGTCGGTCRTTLTGLTPGSHTFVVVAVRSNGAGGTLTTASAGAPVTVAAAAPPPTTEPPVFGGPTSGPPTTPPPPGATPSTTSDPNGDDDGDGRPNGVDDTPGTPKPTASGSPGASVTPSASPSVAPVLIPTTPRRGTTSFGGFSGFGTALSVPGLTLGAAPTIADGAAKTPDGTYDPQLAYDSEIRETTITSTEGGGNALGPIGNVVDSEQLMRTLAAALILLLAGAHLRRWLADASDAR